MSRIVSKIDADGVYVEDVILEDEGPLPPDCIETRPPDGLHKPVWDGSTWVEGMPDSDILASLKMQKINEFATRAVDELRPHFTGEHGREELQAVHNATLIAVCNALGIPVDARMTAVDSIQTRAFSKQAAVESATTIAEVEAITWESV